MLVIMSLLSILKDVWILCLLVMFLLKFETKLILKFGNKFHLK